MNTIRMFASLSVVNCFIFLLLQIAFGYTQLEPLTKIFTTELPDEVLEFYNEENEFNKKSIAKNKETIAKLEARIVKANIDLYEKISEEIDDCNESIDYLEEELENKRYLYNKFYFAKGILDNKSNAEDYDLFTQNVKRRLVL